MTIKSGFCVLATEGGYVVYVNDDGSMHMEGQYAQVYRTRGEAAAVARQFGGSVRRVARHSDSADRVGR